MNPDTLKRAVELAAPKFWEWVLIGETDDDCHIWKGYRNPKGYGRFRGCWDE